MPEHAPEPPSVSIGQAPVDLVALLERGVRGSVSEGPRPWIQRKGIGSDAHTTRGDVPTLLHIWLEASRVGHAFLGEETLQKQLQKLKEVSIPHADN